MLPLRDLNPTRRIGAQMDVTGGTPVIVGVFRGTPADRAGLRAGDRLLAVDGVDVTSEALDAVVRKGIPPWLELERDGFRGRVKSLPARSDIQEPIQEQLIVELYSK